MGFILQLYIYFFSFSFIDHDLCWKHFVIKKNNFRNNNIEKLFSLAALKKLLKLIQKVKHTLIILTTANAQLFNEPPGANWFSLYQQLFRICRPIKHAKFSLSTELTNSAEPLFDTPQKAVCVNQQRNNNNNTNNLTMISLTSNNNNEICILYESAAN